MNKAFIFPGQGSQFVGMGREVYENFSVAKYVYQEVDDAINFNLTKIILEGPEEELVKTENTQPALMACSIAILRVLEEMSGKKFNDICKITAGHSLGQYSAMCAAGNISLRDTAYILKQRGKFMQDSSRNSIGAMAAIIGAKEEDILEILTKASNYGICEVANDNSIDQKVISGEEKAIDFAIEKFKEAGAKAIKLKVSAAFHSSLMYEASLKMEELLSKYQFKDSIIPVIDNVTIDVTNNGEYLKKSLVKQIPGTVKWRQTMEIIAKSNIDLVVEIGAGKVLSNLMKKNYPHLKSISNSSVLELEALLTLSE